MTSNKRRAAIQSQIESFLRLMAEQGSEDEVEAFSVEAFPPQPGDDSTTYRMKITARPLTLEDAARLRELGFKPKEEEL